MKHFLSKYHSQLLLILFIIKSQLRVNSGDELVIFALAALSGYRMYLNSVFDKTVIEQIRSSKDELLEVVDNNNSSNIEARREIRLLIESNHKEVDTSMHKVTESVNKELLKLKTDMGQINLSQGIGNGKKQQIFF